MRKYSKKISSFLILSLVILFVFNLLPCNTKAQFNELLWQRVFWGCRDDGANEGINSMAVYKGKLYIGTLNLAGGEVWYFDGKDWRKSNVEEIPISELPIEQQLMYGLQNPYIAPVILALTLANLLSLIAFTSLLPYLGYLWQLLTEPFLYFSKKKRKWGVVYDALTKQPIDLAIVRLFDAKTKKIIETKVTNLEGKYLFLVNFNKKYFITVSKSGYVFPTRIMATDIKDREYDNLYHGEKFQIGKENEQGFVAYNIPLDLQMGTVTVGTIGGSIKTDISSIEDFTKLDENARNKRNKKIIWKTRLRNINKIIAYLGPILGLTSFILNPGLLTYILLMIHVLVLLLFRRLAMGKRMKPWGRVYDVKNLKALSRAVVRVFDTTYGRLLQVFVTKSDGRYGFLIGDGVSSNIIPTKDGYEFPNKSIKVMGGKEIEKDIAMKKIRK